MTRKYLVTGVYVVTLDDSLSDFENGAVLIEDGIIKAAGKVGDISAPDAEIIDATEVVVIPGIVDTHRHVSMSLAQFQPCKRLGGPGRLWLFASWTHEPSDIDLVMVDGKILKRNDDLAGVDIDAVRAKAREGLRCIQENLGKMRPEMGRKEIEDFFRQRGKAHRACVAGA